MGVHDVLVLHVIVITMMSVIFARILLKQKLFNWFSSGFWAWFAFVLYFVITPLYALLRRDLTAYEADLSIAGGAQRAAWMLAMILVGILMFFSTYLRTTPRPVSWQIAEFSNPYSPSFIPYVISGFLVIGLYSLFLIRGAFISTEREIVIEGGRFVGEIGGYEYTAHKFLIVPILLLMLSKKTFAQILGLFLATIYIVISALDPWGRFTVVSMVIAVTLAFLDHRKKHWPRPVWILLAVFVALLLQARGHARFGEENNFISVVSSIPESSEDLFLSREVGMLRTLYVESYVNDTLLGYDYGIPTLNYALFGFLPSSLFPQKYLMIDWLEEQQGTLNDPVIVARLNGAKSSLLGSFYGHAGFMGVVLFMGIAGVLSRKLDGMVQPDAPLLVRATGFAIMSVLWIVWGSHDTWAIVTIGTFLMPAILIWFVSEKRPSKINRRFGKHRSVGQTVSHQSAQQQHPIE